MAASDVDSDVVVTVAVEKESFFFLDRVTCIRKSFTSVAAVFQVSTLSSLDRVRSGARLGRLEAGTPTYGEV